MSKKSAMIYINISLRKISLALLALFLFAPLCFVSSQIVGTPKIIKVPRPIITSKVKTVLEDGETSAEKSIVVDTKVNISLCVSEGRVKINGWERNEIRAFVGDRSEVGFKVLQKNRQTNNPVWILVTGFDTSKPRETNSEECLSGDEIELDVPRGATVNIKGRTSETTIESVRKVMVKTVAGDISLDNIEEGISAATYEGDITIINSGGAIAVESGNGNIIALDVAPSEIGDIFKAKTGSGAITLEQIEHRQTEISSTSGAIKFAGAFQSGGQYNFNTTNGTILLAIPEKSSCKINATYGFGRFNSEINYTVITEDKTSKAQRLVASIGGGDANVNLTTYSGAIRIKKQ